MDCNFYLHFYIGWMIELLAVQLAIVQPYQLMILKLPGLGQNSLAKGTRKFISSRYVIYIYTSGDSSKPLQSDSQKGFHSRPGTHEGKKQL